MEPKNAVSITTIWRKIESAGFRFFCVGCNRERHLSPPTRVGSFRFFMHIFITSAFFTILAWPWLHLKGIGFFIIPVGLIFEALHRMKMRDALVCPDCNFDPILYFSNRDKAVRYVEERWRKKFEEMGIPYPTEKRAEKRPEKAGDKKVNIRSTLLSQNSKSKTG